MRRLLSPAEVVLAGPPNAGKSTLANALVGRAVSIVHETPGTTRDWVRELAVLGGLPVWITDTAGLWESGDATLFLAARNGVASPVLPDVPLRAEVEAQSARRAVERMGRADVVLLLGQPPADLEKGDATLFLAARNGVASPLKIIPVWTKSDLHPPTAAQSGPGVLPVSARTGEGLDALRVAILRSLGLDDFDPAVPRAFTQRQASLLQSAAEAIVRGNAPVAAESLGRLLQG